MTHFRLHQIMTCKYQMALKRTNDTNCPVATTVLKHPSTRGAPHSRMQNVVGSQNIHCILVKLLLLCRKF